MTVVNYDNYFIIDLETNILNKDVGKHLGSPYCVKNRIVETGWWSFKYNGAHTTREDIKDLLCAAIRSGAVFVGQNLKFDLLYLMRDYEFRNVLPHINIWDTQLAEYLITGQSSKMTSLDKLTVKYGGELKDDVVKAFWKKGIDTLKIPPATLTEYLKHDIINTRTAYLAQLKLVSNMGIFPLVRSQMDFLKASTEMEWNGMSINSKGMKIQEKVIELDAKMLENNLKHTMSNKGWGGEPNPGSNKQISTFLFGATNVKYEATLLVQDEKKEYVKYKTGAKKGQIKRKKMTVVHDYPRLISPDPYVTSNNNGFPVDDAHLKKIIARFKSPKHMIGGAWIVPFLEDLQKYKGMMKDLKTYYVGYGGLVWGDGRIHHNIIHTNTATGRTSCKSPNLQNLSKK